jgi:hypothetical protein
VQPTLAPLPAQPTRALTPRLPSNATSRATPTPLPPTQALPTEQLETADTLPVLPTLVPLAPDVPESLPPFARHGQIWLSDGSEAPPRQLTTFGEGTYAGQPAFSPDGEQIAFVALIASAITTTIEFPASKLFVMKRDGSELREVWAPKERDLWLPAWSPDGQAIYLLVNGTWNAPAGEGGLKALQVVRLTSPPALSSRSSPARSTRRFRVTGSSWHT